MHLSVHLENGQRVYFNEDNVLDRVNNPQKTTLMAFFELCKTDEFAKTLLYSHVPSYYTWKNNKFCRRKQGQIIQGHIGIRKDNVLGRVNTVHPGNAECYYLRLLLHEIRGPQSFISLKTVAGRVYPTFQETCRALGLLQEDAHWDRTLEEAALTDAPTKIREIFAIMLVFCQIGDPVSLWEKHKDSFSEDVKKRYQQEVGDLYQIVLQDIYNQSLILLEDIVISMSGQLLQHFGLPSPLRQANAMVNRAYLGELAYNAEQLREEVTFNKGKLNEDQRKVYEEVLQSVASKSGQLFFLDAPGGTSKTFLLNLLLATVRKEKKIALAVASSGIAATLLDGGKTAHSAFKLPLNLNQTESPLCNISKQSHMAKVLQDAEIIVWDECTMAHKKATEALDRTLRDIRNCNRLMGGLTILLAGDFRQTLPVIPRGTRADTVNACLKCSYLWTKVKTLSLKLNMRVHLYGDLRADEFCKLLLEIGDGKIQEIEGKITIPEKLCEIVIDLKSLTEKIYPDICQKINDMDWLRERAILTPTNDSANNINNMLLEHLLTPVMKYESVDSVLEEEDAVNYPVEFLNSLNPPGFPSMTCI